MKIRDLTELKDAINESSAIDALYAHLESAIARFGVDGFELLLEIDRKKGEHIHMMQIGFENAEIPFTNEQAENILEQFGQCANLDEMKPVFTAMADTISADLRLNKLIVKYERANPGDGNKLRNILLSDAVYRILEVCVGKNHEVLFADWQSAQNQKVELCQTDETTLLSKDKDGMIALEERQENLKNRIGDSAKLLKSARQIATEYVHYDAYNSASSYLEKNTMRRARVKKILLLTKKINLYKLTESTRQLLTTLLSYFPDAQFFDAINPDTRKPNVYLIPDETSKKLGVFRKVILSNSLVRYARKRDNKEYRYAVCNSAPLGEGCFGIVYESDATIFISVDKKATIKIKNTDKSRVVKCVMNGTDAKREAELLEKVVLMHVKKVIVSADGSRASLLMRKFKGKELIDHLMADWGKSAQEIGPNTFTVNQRLALTIMLGEAILSQVHQNQIIHRDIKGDNFMVELDASNNPISVTVIDYGLAKHKGEITTEGVGTSKPIDYRAPETQQKECPVSDEKSDVFSFATLLNELVWRGVTYGVKYSDLSSRHKVHVSVILQKCLCENINSRLSLGEMINEFKSILADRQCINTQNNVLNGKINN